MRFPLFIDLKGRKAVVIGGGAVGIRRARVLLRFGADVTLVSPEIKNNDALTGIDFIKRKFKADDLKGAYLAVAATNDREVNGRISALCRDMGVFVSVADAPFESSFYFPAVCIRDTLCAGVVSEGADHKAVKEAAERIRGVL